MALLSLCCNALLSYSLMYYADQGPLQHKHVNGCLPESKLPLVKLGSFLLIKPIAPHPNEVQS